MSDIQTIKDRIDVVQLISEYIPLKKAGVNWKACCPFHGEKTPSFMVNQERQFWHCFGCQKGGDIFTFIQEMEGLEFPEALKILANRAGVELSSFKTDIDKGAKNRLYEANSKAAYFFNQFLNKMPVAQPAREYLTNRKVDSEMIENWQIGFAPDQWDLLTNYLLKNGFSIDDILGAGLCVKNESRHSYYDVFRGRIMFPIKDIYSNIIGFTGRILVESEKSGGKYVNTSQTAIFDKSRAVYGLDKAKMEIKTQDKVILVEGQMDVIANHKAGFKNAVAASGTALTESHLKLLKRYTNNILFAFDADEAGLKAAKRGIDLALIMGMNVRIISLPEGAGKDADECLKKNPEIWKKAVDEAQNVMDWYFKIVFDRYDGNNPSERQKISDELLTEIDKIQYPVEKDSWLKKLGDLLGVENSVLKDSLKRIKNQQPRFSNNFEDKKTSETPEIKTPDKTVRLIKNLLAITLKLPQVLNENFIKLKREYFLDTEFLPLYEWLEKRYNNNESYDFNQSAEELRSQIDLLVMWAEKEYGGISEKDILKEWSFLLDEIKRDWLKKEKEKLFFELKRAQAAGNKQKEDEILNIVSQLNTV